MNILIKRFLLYLKKVKICSDCTIKAYKDDLLLFFCFIKKHLELGIDIKDINIFILKSIQPDTIYSYLVYLNYYRDNTASSRQRRLEAVRSFFKYLYNYYPAFREDGNVMDSISKIQQMFRLPKYFSLEQSMQLQNVFTKENCRYPERNNAIITTFLNTGVRISELVSLNIDKIDLNNKLCKLIGKGRVESVIYFNDYTLNKINLYLSTRKDNNEALFLSNQNKRISNSAVEDICKTAYKLIGLTDTDNYSSHTLRHTSATLIYKNTKDILVTKEFLRHKNIDTTLIYTHIEDEDIKKAVEANPLANFKCS